MESYEISVERSFCEQLVVTWRKATELFTVFEADLVVHELVTCSIHSSRLLNETGQW